VDTIAFDASSRRESEYHVFGLVCEAKYSAAMAYFRQTHRFRWMTTLNEEEDEAAAAGKAATDEDDVRTVVNIYCKIVAERGESE
jgi:hypothetical protein